MIIKIVVILFILGWIISVGPANAFHDIATWAVDVYKFITHLFSSNTSKA